MNHRLVILVPPSSSISVQTTIAIPIQTTIAIPILILYPILRTARQSNIALPPGSTPSVRELIPHCWPGSRLRDPESHVGRSVCK